MSVRVLDGGSIKSSGTTEEDLEEARQRLLDHTDDRETAGKFIGFKNMPV